MGGSLLNVEIRKKKKKYSESWKIYRVSRRSVRLSLGFIAFVAFTLMEEVV